MRLFNREPRGVVLTVKGQELLPYAERILQLRADLLAAARDTKAMRGLVRLGVAETIVHTWLAKLIERLIVPSRTHARDRCRHLAGELRERLISHQLDIAFLLGPIVEPRIENVALSSYPMAWVADPRLELGPEPVPFRVLADWPIIAYPRSTLPTATCANCSRAQGFGPAHLRQFLALSAQ